MPARKAEVEYDNPRPRDAAIRRAVKDDYVPMNDTESEYKAPTIDSDFNDSYAQQGLQPSVGGAQVQYKKQLKNTASTQINRSQKQTANIAARQQQTAAQDIKAGAGNRGPGTRSVPRISKKSSLKKVVSPKGAKKFVKGSAVAYRNLAIGLWLWFFLQLPVALLSIVLFGATYAVADAIPAMIRGVTGDFVYAGITFVLNTLSAPVNAIARAVFGTDLGGLTENTLSGAFIAAHFIIYIIGLATLIICAFLYLLSNIRCLSGKGAGGKMITFIVAFVGYALPLFNIFPWFIFWVIAVWRYPK
jgi:hypothetical protein